MMTNLTDENSFWAIKGLGALAGSLISVAYILPKGPREAALRFFVGVVSGIIFGSAAGMKISSELGIHSLLDAEETALIGAAVTSLCTWWVLGLMVRAQYRGEEDEKKKTGKDLP